MLETAGTSSSGAELPYGRHPTVKKWLTWSIVAFLLFLAVQDPAATAQIFSNTVDLLGSTADGLRDVVNSVMGLR